MGIYRSVDLADNILDVYYAHKPWTVDIVDAATEKIGISYGVSSSLDQKILQSDFKYTEYLTYRSANHLYYSQFESGSYYQTGSYENYTLQSDIYEKRAINEDILVYTIPQDKFGLRIKPGSLEVEVSISELDAYIEDAYAKESGINYIIDYLQISEGTCVSSSSIVFQDDGEGNLYVKCSDPVKYVGNVIYTHGMCILTDTVLIPFLKLNLNPYKATVQQDKLKLKWEATDTVYTNRVICRISENDFLYTYNRTAVTDIGAPKNNITGSEFRPYFTTVGLYNDTNELLAVAKLTTPVPRVDYIATTVVVDLHR